MTDWLVIGDCFGIIWVGHQSLPDISAAFIAHHISASRFPAPVGAYASKFQDPASNDNLSRVTGLTRPGIDSFAATIPLASCRPTKDYIRPPAATIVDLP